MTSQRSRAAALRSALKNTRSAERAQSQQELEELSALAELAPQDPDAALPPPPFPSGFDISRLASSSRPPEAPRSDDTDGRLDLKALSSPPPAAELPPPPALPDDDPEPISVIRSVVPGALASSPPPPAGPSSWPGSVAGGLPSPPQPASSLPAPTPSALDDELEALMASRGPMAAVSGALGAGLEQARSMPTWLWTLVAGLAGGFAIALAVGGGAEPTTTNATSMAPQTSATTATTPTPAPTTPTPNTMAAMPTTPSRSTPAALTSSTTKRAAKHPRRAKPPTDPGPAAEPAPAQTGEARSIDTLLDQALTSDKKPAAAAAPTSSLPETPTRDAVATNLASVLPEVRFCAGGRSGVAVANVVARSNGGIASVRISGSPFSRTDAGRCMERVILKVRFPPFSKPTFRVTYPYRL